MAKQLDSHNVPRQVRKYIGTAAELAALTLTPNYAGSTFYETDTPALYILNTAGAWVEKISGVSGNVNVTGDVTLTGSLVSVSASMTRPDNTTAYTAGDVLGTDPATNLVFDTGLSAGDGFVILGALLRIDRSTIPAGMTSFRLHLFNAAPTPIVDNAAFNIIAADRGKYIGWVDIVGLRDLGDTLYASVKDVNLTGNLVTSNIYGTLITNGVFTPTALTVKAVGLTIAPL